MALKAENYSVDGFTPSVEKALERIQSKIPDIALLDIDLEGEQTGIDLGKILFTDYKIPFIYVTDYDDNTTFFESLQTHHENFIIKTKPHLDLKQIIRAIQTTLNRNKKECVLNLKDALMCFTDYIGQTKDHNSQQVSQVPIPLEEIILITTDSKEKDERKSLEKGRTCYYKLKANYIRVESWKNRSYYLPISLSEVSGKLPHNFIRINESEIVNLSHQVLEGRINGSKLKINDHICYISKTYKQEVEKRLELLYMKLK